MAEHRRPSLEFDIPAIGSDWLEEDYFSKTQKEIEA